MKYGGIKAVCFVVLACMIVLPVFGDERTLNLRSIIVERFNGKTGHGWEEGRHQRNFTYSWEMAASKFATRTRDSEGNEMNYPRSAFVRAWPIVLFGYNPDDNVRSFGIHGRFDRQGHNWIDVYPVSEDGVPFEIPLPGRVRSLDMWVWGANHDFYLEGILRDGQGMVHTLRFGSLAHAGWKNIWASVPASVPQVQRILPIHAGIRFVKFRIWTRPTEKVGDFYIYFKQFKVLTDDFESMFDGDDLSDPDLIPGIWAEGVSSSAADGR